MLKHWDAGRQTCWAYIIQREIALGNCVRWRTLPGQSMGIAILKSCGAFEGGGGHEGELRVKKSYERNSIGLSDTQEEFALVHPKQD